MKKKEKKRSLSIGAAVYPMDLSLQIFRARTLAYIIVTRSRLVHVLSNTLTDLLAMTGLRAAKWSTEIGSGCDRYKKRDPRFKKMR